MIDGRPALGGVGRATRNLVAGLRARLAGDQLVVFGESRTGPIGLPGWRRVARAVGGGVKGVVTDQMTLPAVAARNRVDVFHSPRYMVPRRIGVPAVVTLYDLTLVDLLRTKKRGLVKYYERWAFFQALSRAAFIITPSETVRDSVVRRFGLDESLVGRIYPQLTDLELLPPPASMPPDMPREFLLSVGTLEPRKNLDRLLDAHQIVWRETRTPLVLAGAYGWSQRDLLRRVDMSHGAVRWLGFVEDAVLAELYRRAVAVVQMSLHEGFDLPVAEALAGGTPVVVSDIPVHREVAASCGVYASAEDSAAVARAVLEVSGWSLDRRDRHREEAARRVAELRQIDPIEQHLEVYRRVIGD
jgi:alpha-1,3-rhamnosyl/mannosyltransferase